MTRSHATELSKMSPLTRAVTSGGTQSALGHYGIIQGSDGQEPGLRSH